MEKDANEKISYNFNQNEEGEEELKDLKEDLRITTPAYEDATNLEAVQNTTKCNIIW